MNHLDQHTELIAKYLAGEIQPAERQSLFEWVQAQPENQQFFDEMVQVWSLTADADTPVFEADFDQAWAKIEASVERQNGGAKIVAMPVRENSRGNLKLPLDLKRWSLAAAILATFGFAVWMFSKQPVAPQLVEIQTKADQKQAITLPDGSRIWLNENTKIAYAPAFENRLVHLEGEAFFSVEKMAGKPFEIASGEATTTVLGTKFNVRAYPAEQKIEVTVEEGKVNLAVTRQPGKSVLLETGESGVVEKQAKTVTEQPEKIANADAWKTQRLVFDNLLLKDVFQSLERYFDVNIEATNPAILECHYSSPFEQPKLEEILTVISSTLNLKVEQQGNVYRVYGEGCQPDN